jgi:hypothetical protein
VLVNVRRWESVSEVSRRNLSAAKKKSVRQPLMGFRDTAVAGKVFHLRLKSIGVTELGLSPLESAGTISCGVVEGDG